MEKFETQVPTPQYIVDVSSLPAGKTRNIAGWDAVIDLSAWLEDVNQELINGGSDPYTFAIYADNSEEMPRVYWPIYVYRKDIANDIAASYDRLDLELGFLGDLLTPDEYRILPWQELCELVAFAMEEQSANWYRAEIMGK